MHLRGGVAALTLVGVVSYPAAAWAQAFEWKGSLSAAGGYNYVLAENPSASTGPFMSLSPSLTAMLDTPRTRHSLNYGVSLTVPFQSDFSLNGPLQYSNRLNYSLHVELDPRTGLTLSAGVNESPSYTFDLTGDPSETPIESSIPGTINLSANASESVSHQLSPSMTFGQSLGFTYGNPIDPLGTIRAKTFGINNGLTLSNQFALDTLSLSANVSFNHFTAGEIVTGGATDPQSTFLTGLTLTWRRPLTPDLSASLNVGVTENSSLEAPGVSFAPAGGASLSYTFDFAAATLSASHAMTVNGLTASVNSTDQVSLRFTAPLGESGFTSSGTVGFVRATPVNPDGAPASPSDSWTGDVGLSFTPKSLAQISTSLRGQVQRAVPSDDPAQGFTRFGLTFSLTYSFPSATAARRAPSFSGAPVGGVVRESPPSELDRGPGYSPRPEELVVPPAAP